MTGDDSRLPFALLFSLRSHAVRQPALTVLTILAVATSVALAVALQMSSASVQAEFTRTANSLTGSAQIEITAGKVGIPEVLLAEAEATPGVLSASPVIQATVRHAQGPLKGEPLHILGVDLLADREIRSYSIISKDLRILDAPMLIASVDSVIISEVLANRLGIQERDSISVRSSRGTHQLVVRGILASGGLADAYGGQVAVMDVFSLQQILGREGWIDRIDITVKPGHEAGEVMTDLKEQLADRATVRSSANRHSYAATAMSTMRLAAGLFSIVGVLVAAFLSYGAISVSVDRRSREFALLRAAGLESKRVRRLIYVDSLVVAALGTTIGLAAGLWFARAFLAALSGTSIFLQNTNIEVVSFGAKSAAIGIAVGIFVGLFGSAAAARRSSTRPPLEVLTSAPTATGPPLDRISGRIAVGLSTAAVWLLLLVIPVPVPALVNTAAVFGLGIVVLTSIMTPLLSTVLSSARARFERLVPGIGRVVGGSLRMRPNHTRTAIAGIAALLCATSALLIVLSSLVQTIDESSSAIPGEVMVSTSDPFMSLQRELVLPQTAKAVAETPGVGAVFHHFMTETLFKDEVVGLSAISSAVLAENGHFPLLKDADQKLVARLMEAGGVVTSEAFARHFGVTVGEALTLKTPEGPRDFPIVGVGRSFGSGTTGSLRMDIGVFDAIWPRTGSSNLLIWPDSDEVLSVVQKRAGVLQPLFFVRSEQLDRFMHDMVAKHSYPLYLLMALTVFLGGLSVMNLLIGSVVERRRDLALLRAAGATSHQIFNLVLADGLIVSTIGVLAGITLGVACSIPMNKILTEAFGWSIVYSPDVKRVAFVALGTITFSLVAALYPGWNARREPPAQVLSPE